VIVDRKEVLMFPFARLLSLATTAALLAGCAAERPADQLVKPDPRLVPAAREAPSDAPLPKVVEVKVPVVGPQLRPASPARSGTEPPKTIMDAKSAATTQPSPEGFINATQYYDYAPGMVYTAVTSPGFVTSIALRPGEKLITAAAGDTTRWVVESVESGAGANQQVLLLIKPRKPLLQTNLVITTDQRVYQVDLTSTDGPTYQTMIAWNYPYGDVVAIRNRVQQEVARQQTTVAGDFDLQKIHFNYLILKQKGDTPPWCPLRAFDDGQKTYIQFPPKAAVTEAPPLFVLTPGGAQLVNYRVKGDYYVVDRLIDRAELRLGEKQQVVVAIQRASVKE
jgi:type IV secretion system protein VirB9